MMYSGKISELPDDILVFVVSLLTLKEAAKTSILAKRWRHMWVYNPNLIFDYSHLIDFNYPHLLDEKKPKYLNLVDKLVKSHKAPTIDEFRVCIDIRLLKGRYTSRKIANWFRFAIEKRVKRLEIDLGAYRRSSQVKRRHTFPSITALCSNTLTSLKLGFINIDGETLERTLCDCQALEYLSVKYSNLLVNLKVSGPFLNLKHLKIHADGDEIRQLEISAPKLESFRFLGTKINVQFKYTPKLVQVSISGYYGSGLTSICSDLSNYVSQIKIFRIEDYGIMYNLQVYDSVIYQSLEESVLFARLEKLEITPCPCANDTFYCLTLVIKACPLLQHFKLELDQSLLRPSSSEREQMQWEARLHYHLEILEIVGFIGYPIDLEFAAYLMKSAPSLKKITRTSLMKRRPKYLKDTKKRRLARERAELLRANLNSLTKLEIV